MKKSSIFAGVAVASAMFVSAPGFAVGYDSSTENRPSGGREDELHALQFTTQLEDCSEDPDNPGSTFCESSFSLDSEFTAVLFVDNNSPCIQQAGLGGACRNLGAGAGSTTQDVTDTYTGGAFNTAAGNPPSVLYTSVFLPDCPETVASGACFRETALTSSFYSWNFNTNEDGAITTGYVIADSNFGATGQTVGVFIFNTDGSKVVRTYRGAASDGFPNALARDCAVDSSTVFEDCWEGGGTSGGSAEQGFEYITVPQSDLELTKAVPVPAFAAAVLGLGLIGITVLTGRRRRIS